MRRITIWAMGLLVLLAGGCGRQQAEQVGPTGEGQHYALYATDSSKVGTLSLERLSDGNTRIGVQLTGLDAAHTYAIRLHYSTPTEVSGNVQADSWGNLAGLASNSFDWYGLPNGRRLDYQALQNFDGHVRVVDAQTGATVATADIGQNQLTGRHFAVNMHAVSVASIYGRLEVYERKNGYSLVRIALRGTQAGNNHPAHFHLGGNGLCGTVSVSLKDVDGATGISMSTVTAHDLLGVRNEGAPITYAQLADWSGCIEVHQSSSQLGTLIALY